MASTKRLDLFVTSGRSRDFIIDYAYDRANSRDEDDNNFDEDGKKIYAHYYDITYFRDNETIEEQKEKDDEPTWVYPIQGDKHMVFGADALDMMSTLNKNEDVLNKKQFIRGFTDEVVINDANGSANIELNGSNPYNVFLQVKDDLQAIVRVENESSTSFDIIVYDGEAYTEDRVRLDCSIEPVTVNYNVVYV